MPLGDKEFVITKRTQSSEIDAFMRSQGESDLIDEIKRQRDALKSEERMVWSGDHSNSPGAGWDVIIFYSALFIGCIAVVIWIATKPGTDNKKNEDQDDPDYPETGKCFTASSGYIQNINGTLRDADSGTCWTSDSAAHHKAQVALLENSTNRMAETSQQVQAVVQGQAERVHDGRETLQNLLDGLTLAIPTSEALYMSGPAGPALSYQFQLAVSSPAVSTSVDTTNNMNENSQKNAAQLNILTQQYADIFESIHLSLFARERA